MAARTTGFNRACDICGLEELDEESMRVHMMNFHIEKTSSCLLRNASHNSPDALQNHKSTCHINHLSLDNEKLNFIDDDDDDGGDDDGDGLEKLAFENRTTKNSNLTSNNHVHTNSNFNNNNNNNNTNNNNNINYTSPVEYNLGAGGRGSPLRTQLNLPLETNVPPLPIKVQQEEKCMLCGHLAVSAIELQEHINKKHFDLTSPSITHFPSGSTEEWRCPLCVQTFQNGVDLEFHVNIKHRDILSPVKGSCAGGLDNWGETCPVCYRSNFKSSKEMENHIEDHFSNNPDSALAKEIEKREMESMKEREQEEFKQLQAQYGMDNQGNFKEQSLTNMQKAVYAGEMSVSDFYQRQLGLRFAENNGVDDGSSCTKDLLPRIRAISHLTTNVVKTLTCTAVDHYASTYGDEGWGCGYRNLQMLMSSLLQHTECNEHLFRIARNLFQDCRGVVSRSAIPSISKLQQQIELAWHQGFDIQGCEQLGGKLYNTRKWIGATEVVTALSSLRIRCQLIDFHRPTGPEGSHPMLFNWVLQFFEKNENFKYPLYLQHHGHSRTIVGIEEYKDGHLTLLIFDPSRSREQMMQLKNAINGHACMKFIRKTLPGMKARQYQLVAVRGIIQSDSEYEQSKLLRSTRIP